MEGQSYHFEFNALIEEIDRNLFLKNVSADRYQLQFKSAYLKSCRNQQEYKPLALKSLLRPVILNELKNARNFKVNALCEKALYHNAVINIEKLAHKQSGKNEDKKYIFLKWEDDKYFFDCKDKSWKSLQKDQLFQRQYDVISHKKLFRINFSVKTQTNVTQQVMKALLQKRKNNGAFLRFKRTTCCKVYDLFDIECSVVYESEDDQQVKLVKSWIDKYGDNIEDQISQKVELEKKKNNTKYQLELKINQKGIEFLKKCEETQMKQQISKAFNTLRDITNQTLTKQGQLTNMMAQVSLTQKKEKTSQAEKGDKKVVQDIKIVKPVKQQQEELQFIVRRK